MSFAILRHAKIKSSTKGAAISHNHRLSEVEKININPAQKHLNRSFLGDGAKDRIDALLPEKMRKDAVVSVETLLTASPDFFDGLEKDRAKLAKNPVFLAWVDESLGWAKKEFGANLVDVVLHMDESSPHIHVLSVPLIDGRLCAKEVMARKELQRRQTEYFQAVKGFGLERGVPAEETKRRHIGLKEAPGAGGQASQLAAKLAASEAELTKTRERFDRSFKLSMGDMGTISKLKEKVAKMDEYSKKLEAKLVIGEAKIAQVLIEKAEAIEALVKSGEKSEALLVTADGHRLAAEKLTGELAEVKAKFAAMATEYEDFKKAGNAPALFVPGAMAPEPSKSLLERIEEWVKGLVEKFGIKPSDMVEGQTYHGKCLAVMDGAWAQKTDRDGAWVVHHGRAPQLNTQAEVKFKGGNSEVKGMDDLVQQQKGGIAR